MTTRNYLVIGGVGFLGSHVVRELVSRGERSVAVYDLVDPEFEDERVENVRYFKGDITDAESLTAALQETNCSLIFHVASPIHGLADEVYDRVNRVGTEIVLSVCQHVGVKKLVYTSSVGVIWIGKDIAGLNEDELTYPSKGYDAYHHTKALAEQLVLDATGVDGLQTVILRPCGMIGEYDKQAIVRFAAAFRDGQTNVQIGDNKNKVDYMYAGNTAYAQVLAADRLYDSPDTVNGQVFFITNDQPMYLWDFSRMIWKEMGDDGLKPIMRIPRVMGYPIAIIAEYWAALTGTKTKFDRFTVLFTTCTQWYNIDKAKKLLGYKPKVSLEEGIQRAVAWWNEVGTHRYSQQTAGP